MWGKLIKSIVLEVQDNTLYLSFHAMNTDCVKVVLGYLSLPRAKDLFS